MLEIMLCGAEDTEQIRPQFVDVVESFGGTPLHYLSGDVRYINSLRSQWTDNSRATVEAADICVFVVVERFGTITWGTELRAALDAGVPFLVLCLASTYAKYLTLLRSVDNLDAVRDDSDRKLVEALYETESLHQLTVVPFERHLFTDILRKQLAGLLTYGLEVVQEQNRRRSLAPLLYDPDKLTGRDLVRTAEVARDELEDKTLRKRALLALAARGACDEDTLRALLESSEQGIQRLAVQELDRLYRARPPDSSFLSHVVDLVNMSDDVALVRRLIPQMFEFGVGVAVPVLEGLEISEIGTRRRLANALADVEMSIVDAGVTESALRIARKCEEGAVPTEWKARLRDLIARLEAETQRD
jgi:hypothetical protein